MSDTPNSLINTITVGTSVKGDIQANGDFRIDGTVEGNITMSGKFVLGENGMVKGNVICQNANVLGFIDGDISVKEMLTLYEHSKIKGDIVASKLAIEPGAKFNGACHMLDELSD